MKKVLIYAEGQTEERFIKDLLAPHLQQYKIYPQPVVATTKIVKSGTNFKGGIGKYSKAKKEILNLLNDRSAAAVSTMIDYYGLSRSFPGRENPRGKDCFERVAYVEHSIYDDIGSDKFIPFLTLHEFEGLLFSSPMKMANAIPGGEQFSTDFSRIRDGFSSPEEINDNPSTAPHQRIIDLYPGYNKPLHGTLIAYRIGLNNIMNECAHFRNWILQLVSV